MPVSFQYPKSQAGISTYHLEEEMRTGVIMCQTIPAAQHLAKLINLANHMPDLLTHISQLFRRHGDVFDLLQLGLTSLILTDCLQTLYILGLGLATPEHSLILGPLFRVQGSNLLLCQLMDRISRGRRLGLLSLLRCRSRGLSSCRIRHLHHIIWRRPLLPSLRGYGRRGVRWLSVVLILSIVSGGRGCGRLVRLLAGLGPLSWR